MANLLGLEFCAPSSPEPPMANPHVRILRAIEEIDDITPVDGNGAPTEIEKLQAEADRSGKVKRFRTEDFPVECEYFPLNLCSVGLRQFA